MLYKILILKAKLTKSKKALLKRCVFKSFLKVPTDSAILISEGKSFQSFGAEATKARSPKVVKVLTFGWDTIKIGRIKAKSENSDKKAQGSRRIINHRLPHNHNSLRHITAHPKSSHSRITTIPRGIPLRILNLPFAHNHNSLRLVRKSDCKPL